MLKLVKKTYKEAFVDRRVKDRIRIGYKSNKKQGITKNN